MTVNLGDSQFECNFAPVHSYQLNYARAIGALEPRFDTGGESREFDTRLSFLLLFFPHSPELRLQQLQSGRQFQKRRVTISCLPILHAHRLIARSHALISPVPHSFRRLAAELKTVKFTMPGPESPPTSPLRQQSPLLYTESPIDQPGDRLINTSSNANGSRFGGTARRTLGISLLLVVVVLWTASNFLASVCVFFLLFVLHWYFQNCAN